MRRALLAFVVACAPHPYEPPRGMEFLTPAAPPPTRVVPPPPSPPIEPVAPTALATATRRAPEVVWAQLKSGMRIGVVEQPSLPLVELSLVIPSGGTSGRPGVPALTAGLVAQGAAAEPAWHSQKLAVLGARFSVKSSADATVFSIGVRSDRAVAAIGALGDMIGRAQLRNVDFDALRKLAMADAQAKARSDDAWAARELLTRIATGHAAAATWAELSRNRFAHCATFFKTHYSADGALLLASGAIEATTVTEAARAAFARAALRPRSTVQPDRGGGEEAGADSTTVIHLIDRPFAPRATLHGVVPLAGASDDNLGTLLAAGHDVWLRAPAASLSFYVRPWQQDVSPFAAMTKGPPTEASVGAQQRRWAIPRELTAILSELSPVGLSLAGLSGTIDAGARTALAERTPSAVVVVGDRQRVESALREHGEVRVVDPLSAFTVVDTLPQSSTP